MKRPALTNNLVLPGFPVVPGNTGKRETLNRPKEVFPSFPGVSRCFPETLRGCFPEHTVLTGAPRETLAGGSEPLPSRETGNGRGARVFPVSHEVLELPARLLGSLPLRTTLSCQLSDGSLPFTITASRARWAALRASRAIVFGLLELGALTCAAANDRANAASLRLWCEYKMHTPTWRLTVSGALDGLVESCVVEAPERMTIGAVLSAWGAELVGVHVDNEVPA